MVNPAAPASPESAKLDAACARAVELQLSGELALAEQLYRAVLAAQPRHAAANHCLGMLKVQSRRAEEGLTHLAAAIEAQPESSDYRLGYLEGLLAADRIDEARQALELARSGGLSGKAVRDYSHRLKARSAERRRQMAMQRKEEAALSTLIEQRQFGQARALALGMTQRFAASGLAFKVLGAIVSAQGRAQEALDLLETAVRLLPSDAEALINLGLNLIKLRRLEEAEACLKRAIELAPDQASAHFRLAMTYGLRNDYAGAEKSIRAGMTLDHGHVTGDCELTLSAFLFIVSHNPAVSADELFAMHRRAGDLLEQHVRARWPEHRNQADPDRRLKIGFMSGDFYHHAVSLFVEPVLAQLKDHPGLELHAYYNNTIEDDVNGRLRTHFAQFSHVHELVDERLAKRIAADGIDIVIDLSGHSGNNRLPALARKPAPVQVSWIGYPGTTGLHAMDYYLTDRHFLPPGQFDRYFTEKLVYLPANAPFYPFVSTPDVNPLPALEAGFLTFGSFNRLGKVNPQTIDLWSAVLNAVPEAKFLVGAIDTDAQEKMLIEELTARGILGERLGLHRRCGTYDYLKLHQRVDICLDAFPYAGGTTTMQALWMGVPTLTVAGSTPASRQGAAIAGQLGLEQFIATDAPDLAAKARYWTTRLAELAELRGSLRARVQKSPARQPELIAASLAGALRRMWHRWCEGLPPESFAA